MYKQQAKVPGGGEKEDPSFKAKAQCGEKEDPSFKVKNTFLEFSIPGEVVRMRRSRSDLCSPPPDPRLSPLVVASKSPFTSPMLKPSDEKLHAVPIEEVNFELLDESVAGPYVGSSNCGGIAENRIFDGASNGGGSTGGGGELVAQSNAGLGREEPAYVVPTTPSPFLHSAFPPAAVPPFGNYGYGMPDMGLPPAYEDDGQGGDGNFMLQDMDGPQGGWQGMSFLPEMYDGGYAQAEGTFEGNFAYNWSTWSQEGGEASFNPNGDMGQDITGLGVASVLSEGTARASAYPCDAAQAPEAERAAASAASTVACGAASASASKSDAGAAVREAAASVATPAQPAPEEMRAAKEGRRSKGNKNNREQQHRDEEKPERRSREAPAAASGSVEGQAEVVASSAGGDGVGDAQTGFTTVMLRNIPNKYTREMLIKQLSVEFYGLYDFMYLPIDFKNKCNVGYGFINFRTPEACAHFVSQFHGVDVRKCLPGLNSKKIVEVTPARVQGLSENVRRLKNSPVMNQLQDHPEWMPLLFNSAGQEEPFPMPDTPLPPVKPRGRNRDKNSDG